MFTITDWYPYGLGDILNVAVTLKERFNGELIIADGGDNKLGFELAIRNHNQRVVFDVSAWRQPSNALVDISYVCLCVHDETEAEFGEGWKFYYFTNIKTEQHRSLWKIPALINRAEEFIVDARKTSADERFSCSHELGDNSGRWPGGVAMIPANFPPKTTQLIR